jgi:predicted nucleic acid-binding protein
MSKAHVLDTSAVIHLVEDQAGAEPMEALIREAVHLSIPLLMSVMNWGEVFYHAWQLYGEEAARRTMGSLSRLPIELVAVDLPQVMKAGEIKAVHKIPYVDSIAAALAEMRGGVLVTSDRDFEKLGRRVPVLWIARP